MNYESIYNYINSRYVMPIGLQHKKDADYIEEESFSRDIAYRVAYIYDYFHDGEPFKCSELNPAEDPSKTMVEIKFLKDSSESLSKDQIAYHIQFRPSHECLIIGNGFMQSMTLHILLVCRLTSLMKKAYTIGGLFAAKRSTINSLCILCCHVIIIYSGYTTINSSTCGELRDLEIVITLVLGEIILLRFQKIRIKFGCHLMKSQVTCITIKDLLFLHQ